MKINIVHEYKYRLFVKIRNRGPVRIQKTISIINESRLKIILNALECVDSREEKMAVEQFP